MMLRDAPQHAICVAADYASELFAALADTAALDMLLHLHTLRHRMRHAHYVISAYARRCYY